MKIIKKNLIFILLIICAVAIFFLSNQNAKISSSESSSMISGTVVFACKMLNMNIGSINCFVNAVHEPLREFMHSFEYLLLGFLVVTLLDKKEFKKYIIISIMFCFAFSAFDEIHQLFVAGRNFEYFDLFMDSIGYISGILMYKYVFRKSN